MNSLVDRKYRGFTIRTYATPREDGSPDVVVMHPRGGVEYTARDQADAEWYCITHAWRERRRAAILRATTIREPKV